MNIVSICTCNIPGGIVLHVVHAENYYFTAIIKFVVHWFQQPEMAPGIVACKQNKKSVGNDESAVVLKPMGSRVIQKLRVPVAPQNRAQSNKIFLKYF